MNSYDRERSETPPCRPTVGTSGGMAWSTQLDTDSKMESPRNLVIWSAGVCVAASFVVLLYMLLEDDGSGQGPAAPQTRHVESEDVSETSEQLAEAMGAPSVADSRRAVRKVENGRAVGHDREIELRDVDKHVLRARALVRSEAEESDSERIEAEERESETADAGRAGDSAEGYANKALNAEEFREDCASPGGGTDPYRGEALSRIAIQIAPQPRTSTLMDFCVTTLRLGSVDVRWNTEGVLTKETASALGVTSGAWQLLTDGFATGGGDSGTIKLQADAASICVAGSLPPVGSASFAERWGVLLVLQLDSDGSAGARIDRRAPIDIEVVGDEVPASARVSLGSGQDEQGVPSKEWCRQVSFSAGKRAPNAPPGIFQRLR